MASDHRLARDRAARLLRKQGSRSSLASSTDITQNDRHQKLDSESTVSSISYRDNPTHDDHFRIPVKFENTYQLEPTKKFPHSTVNNIIKESMENLLSDEHYRPDFCRDVTKTLSETIKARIKSLMIPRYKIICLVQIGELKSQGIRVGSRCLWDDSNDTFWTHEFRNKSIYAIASVYGIYYE